MAALAAIGLLWAQQLAPPPPVHFTVAASGDFLIHTPVRGAGARGRRGPPRLPADVQADPQPHRGRGPGPVPRRDPARARPGAGVSELPHAAVAGKRDPGNGVGRVQHGVQPLARRRPARRAHDDRCARPGGPPAFGHGAVGPGRAARSDPPGQGRSDRVPLLHGGVERPGRAAPVERGLGRRAAHPPRRPPGPPPRRRHRDREPALGRRVQPRDHRPPNGRSPGA